MTPGLMELSIAQAGKLLRSRETTSVALTHACLERMETLEPRLNAFITVTADGALAEAAAADEELARGQDRGPLQGIPIAIKDLCATAGVRTTAGSKVLESWMPDFDATVVTRLKQAGAVSVGKLNLHEFAYGATSNNVFYGAVHNPWALDHHPGGSSGGSGAAVAAGECFAAIGSDTGGSIRIPAALCGVVGLMPTYGLVSRAGVTALSWSLDHIGPLARTVEDAALFLNAIAGHDPADPGSVRREGFDAASLIGRDIKGVRVGVLRSQFARVEDGVAQAVESAIEALRGLGAEVRDVQIPMLDAGFRVSILQAEASAYHAQWLRERPQDYSDQVRTLLLWGLTIPAHEYLNDLRLRRQLTEEVRTAMQSVDLVAMPTCPAVTCPIDKATDGGYLYANLTGPWDHTGQPVISVPCGFGREGLPVGLSLAARPFEEALLCQVAHAYERGAGWADKHPPV